MLNHLDLSSAKKIQQLSSAQTTSTDDYLFFKRSPTERPSASDTLEELLEKWDMTWSPDVNLNTAVSRRKKIMALLIMKNMIQYHPEKNTEYAAQIRSIFGEDRLSNHLKSINNGIVSTLPNEEDKKAMLSIFDKERQKRYRDSSKEKRQRQGFSSPQQDFEPASSNVDPQYEYLNDFDGAGEFDIHSLQLHDEGYPTYSTPYWYHQSHPGSSTSSYQDHLNLDHSEDVAAMFHNHHELHEQPHHPHH